MLINVLATIGAEDCLPEQIVSIIGSIINIIQFGVPIIMVVMAMIDLGKAVTSQKDDEIKKATSMLVKRLLFGVLIFLIPVVIEFVFGIADADSALGCMNTILEV